MMEINLSFHEQTAINKIFLRHMNKMLEKIIKLEKEVKELKESEEIRIKKEDKPCFGCAYYDTEKEPKDFELFVRNGILSFHLNIGFNVEDVFYELGYIKFEGDKGECHFLGLEHQKENWEIWKENGFNVAVQEPVKWQGLFWKSDSDTRLIVTKTLVGIKHDLVYDFKNKHPYTDITSDRDFLKKDSCLRIHLY